MKPCHRGKLVSCTNFKSATEMSIVKAQFNICIFQPCDLTLFDNSHATHHNTEKLSRDFVDTLQGTFRGKGESKTN